MTNKEVVGLIRKFKDTKSPSEIACLCGVSLDEVERRIAVIREVDAFIIGLMERQSLSETHERWKRLLDWQWDKSRRLSMQDLDKHESYTISWEAMSMLNKLDDANIRVRIDQRHQDLVRKTQRRRRDIVYCDDYYLDESPAKSHVSQFLTEDLARWLIQQAERDGKPHLARFYKAFLDFRDLEAVRLYLGISVSYFPKLVRKAIRYAERLAA